jgi:TatD DNase family protein
VWFDSHCHLQLCEQTEVSQILGSARAAGVEKMVVIGIDGATSRAAHGLATEHDLFFSAGLHPNQADEWHEVAGAVEELLTEPRCVAIGETGIDFYRMGAPRDVQEGVFARHIALAKDHDKALVIHTRDSLEAAFEMLERIGPPERLVFHCWSGGPNDVGRALDTGAYISFAGNVSFPSAESLRESAKLVPPERLLVETDSPYLSPAPRRGRSNEPGNVVLVGSAVADTRGEPVEEVAATTAANASRLFGI